MSGRSGFFYPVFKMCLGVLCLVLCAEYLWAYFTYNNVWYIGDVVTWLLSGAVLLFEGWGGYMYELEVSLYRCEERRDRCGLNVDGLCALVDDDEIRECKENLKRWGRL